MDGIHFNWSIDLGSMLTVLSIIGGGIYTIIRFNLDLSAVKEELKRFSGYGEQIARHDERLTSLEDRQNDRIRRERR